VKTVVRITRILLLISLMAGFVSMPMASLAASEKQEQDPATKAANLAALLTPEEKVGQLFLVTFKGTCIDQTTQIYDLIVSRHIGGVVFKAANNNFMEDGNTTAEAQRLISEIQTIAWTAAQPVGGNEGQNLIAAAGYIPLLIGISQEGDQAPFDQIFSDVTPLPNEMTIGATWDVQNARKVGNVLGTELHAIGFNLLLGPSLDVLDVLHSESTEDLGTRTFGGDPYWVGVMGQAFIEGVHEGSGNGIAVISKHFPGRGGRTDRLKKKWRPSANR